MARQAAPALALLLGLALAAAAAAQPCIPCSACFTSHCWQVCQPSCSYAPITPDNVIVSGDSCKRAGRDYGPTAAQSACDTTKLYCNGGYQQNAQALGAIGPVTLSQCSNVAMGSCQQAANSAWLSPCGWQLATGYGQCSGDQFRQFYNGETQSLCRDFARTVTDVDPGTNTWAGGAAPLGASGNRRLLAAARKA